MHEMSITSPAKINRFLHVVGRRDNGYHELETLFQFLDFADNLHFCLDTTDYSGTIRRHDIHQYILPQHDLISQAASILAKEHGKPLPAVDVTLHKHIPPGSGLGGGSSNAASTLLALNSLWQLQLSEQTLLDIAVGLGADVPIFIKGHAALATGIGDIFTSCTAPACPIILALPPVHATTAEVFAKLTPPYRVATKDIKSLAYSRENDLENVACQLFPEIGDALTILREYGDARMSGTGAAVYLLCEDLQCTNGVLRELQQNHPEIAWHSTHIRNTHPALGN